MNKREAVKAGRELGARGGRARTAKMTPEQIRESAKKALTARWAKYRAAQTEKARQDGGIS